MRLLIFNLKTDADDHVLGFTTDWINALAKHCERIVVISMCAGRIAVAPNVRVLSVGLEKGWSRPRRVLKFYRILLEVVRGERIDACFAHMNYLFAIMAWPVLKPRRIPIVLWYAHSHVPPLLRLATSLVDRVVTSTDSAFRIRTKKKRLIGQGVDTQRFRPGNGLKDPEHFVLLTVGRISRVKRLEVAIELLAELPEKAQDGRKIIVRFVGDPLTSADQEYLDELKALVVERGMGHRVEFHPAIPYKDVPFTHASADLFISCAQHGSLDKAVLEAMSSGLPVVTSLPAFKGLLSPELSEKCLVDGYNNEEWGVQLSALLHALPHVRAAIGEAMRSAVVNKYSIESLSQKVILELSSARSSEQV